MVRNSEGRTIGLQVINVPGLWNTVIVDFVQFFGVFSNNEAEQFIGVVHCTVSLLIRSRECRIGK